MLNLYLLTGGRDEDGAPGMKLNWRLVKTREQPVAIWSRKNYEFLDVLETSLNELKEERGETIVNLDCINIEQGPVLIITEDEKDWKDEMKTETSD